MSDYGALEYNGEWEKRPVETYLSYKRKRDEVTKRRHRQIERVVSESPTGAQYEAWDELVDWRSGMCVDDGWRFLQQLRSAGLAPRTVREYSRMVQSFLGVLLERGVIESNPVAYVRDEVTFEPSQTRLVERTVNEVGSFLSSVPDPQYRAAGVLFAKTGIRNGECVNLDLADLNLADKRYRRLLDRWGVSFHDRVADRPDTLFVSSVPTVGESYRGEHRDAGNKRQRDTLIPVDSETKRLLLQWILQRPTTEHPHPLWTGKHGVGRIGVHSFGSLLTGRYAAEAGIVTNPSDSGFTPHWFRHMFTTQLKPGHGDHERSLATPVIRYLRGDVVGDITDVYTHDWGNTVRSEYLRSIYQFGFDQESSPVLTTTREV